MSSQQSCTGIIGPAAFVRRHGHRNRWLLTQRQVLSANFATFGAELKVVVYRPELTRFKKSGRELVEGDLIAFKPVVKTGGDGQDFTIATDVLVWEPLWHCWFAPSWMPVESAPEMHQGQLVNLLRENPVWLPANGLKDLWQPPDTQLMALPATSHDNELFSDCLDERLATEHANKQTDNQTNEPPMDNEGPTNEKMQLW